MKTININFDKKSIQNAITQIRNIKDKIKHEVPPIFLTYCLEWIKNRANEYLSNIPMDSEVIADIQTSWNIEQVNQKKMRLVNTSNKSVYVEFGVGVVGQSNSHPQAGNEGYEYNVPSDYKQADGRWVFNVKHKEYAIDLNEGYFGVYQRENSGKVVAITKGSPANLYLYNAAMDLISTGIYKEFWNMSLSQAI